VAELRALAPEPEGFSLAYERFLSDLYKGERGQYFTPPPLARLLWSRLPDPAGRTVLDPTCGSGGLLAPIARSGARLVGVEVDGRLVRLARAQLRLLGAAPDLLRADVFRVDLRPADVIVANPPFSVRLTDPEVLAAHRPLVGARSLSSDVALLARLAGWLVPGGHAAVVVPWSVVANPTHAETRRRLLADFEVEAVLGLPEGVFRPFGGATGRAAIVWLRRGSGPRHPSRAWFRTLTDPGWDVRSRHLRFTDPAEREAVARGEGFERLPPDHLVPGRSGDGPGRPVSSHAHLVGERGRPANVADLSDLDPVSGDLRPRSDVAPQRRAPVIRAGDVVFARLRPALGVVGVHPGGPPIAGSPEWIVLRPARWPRWLRHALRTPTFRRALPTAGQTRPRTTVDAVLGAVLPAPSEPVRAIVDAVSASLAERHRRASAGLRQLQAAVDAHAAGEIDDDALAAVARGLQGAAGPTAGALASEDPVSEGTG
jgi:SAM-dependent methyltransferase